MDAQYQHQQIELNTQNWWQTNKTFEVTEDPNKEKYYCLAMFPYPSGQLHMGHVRNYTLPDVIARYQRMLGKNVLQPIGWDAFGLPAENAAIKHKIAPFDWTYKNIATMRDRLLRLGIGYDLRREFATCDPNYYRFEQWLFLKLYEKGLVYKKSAEVNWDPVDQTILANEQVIDGRGWRSNALVERRLIPQWFFKITAYAERLLNDLDKLPGWPDQVKTMQRNWIGRSEGAEITFAVQNEKEPLTVFTTRPDTLFGVSYLAIAPQHPLAVKASTHNKDIAAFLIDCRHTKVAEMELATLPKKGILTHFKALHPLTKELLPIWIANFVLMDYGSGAIMGVPAHDERDFEFAKQYDLPIKPVIKPFDKEWDYTKNAYIERGSLLASASFTDLPNEDAKKNITAVLIKNNLGKTKIQYRLRDWSISRQRYWGTPIPMINCPKCGDVPVSENDLPVILPTNVKFDGITSPLKTLPQFYETTCSICHGKATRETETFDTFLESSWYDARFTCADNNKSILDARAHYWLPVDQYVGGIEHAVMHLLYARFIHKALYDLKLINVEEPFTNLLTQGMVLKDGSKMSKSKGNTIDPLPLIEQFGADTVRLFMIFASPPEQSLEWSQSGIEGAHRFLKRIWAYAFTYHAFISTENKNSTASFNDTYLSSLNVKEQMVLNEFNKVFTQIQYDYERLQLNTVVSGCMKLFNLLIKLDEQLDKSPSFNKFIKDAFGILLRLLSPIAPHITHALWQELGYQNAIINAAWPKPFTSHFKTNEIEMVVQVNGKLRAKIILPENADNKTIETMVLKDPKIKEILQNNPIKKLIIVPKRLVNIVMDKST